MVHDYGETPPEIPDALARALIVDGADMVCLICHAASIPPAFYRPRLALVAAA